MGPALSSGTVFRFGLFEADVARQTLIRKGARVRIQDKPFRALILLLDNAGKVVTREELRQALWPEGIYVDFDGSLNVTLKKLRAAIDDDSDNPRFVETVRRQGYRFIAPVSILQPEAVEGSAKPAGELDSGASSVAASSAIPAAKPRILMLVAAVVVLLASIGGWYFLLNHSVVQAAPKAIAVLPLANEQAGQDFDYLTYAIANDLVTDLSYAHNITVRPFASTAKYAGQRDAAAAGIELRVSHVLSGGFLRDQQNLRVHLELMDVAQNKAVWRDQLVISPQELIGLHQKLADSAIKRLLPAINISGASAGDIPSPKNEHAFDLFLHSTMVSLDPGPNQMAIQKLEQSIALDGGYAPAWHQLAWRYYLDYHHGNGGETAKAKSLAAYNRERELDPNAAPWVSLRVEQGDLPGAYDEVSGFLRRHPTDAGVHFSLSYVLRYAGVLDESRKECEVAFALDPVHGYRSCGLSFILAGDYAGPQKFINLDQRSGFASLMRMDIALRMGNTSTALAEASAAEQLGYHDVNAKLVRVFLSYSSAELAKAVAEVEADPVASGDSELLYQNAEALAFCQQDNPALRQLRKAIEGKYCSYPAMDSDPLFASIRELPGFAEARSAGIQCQQQFLAHKKQADARLAAAR